MNVLFLSYDGMTDPLGPSQVLPYLVGLARRGHRIHLASLEKPQASIEARAEISALCERSGIDWHPLRFRSDLPFIGVFENYRQLLDKARELHRADRLDLIHARSYIPALAALRLKREAGTGFLFDMRGFWPDERVDGGQWPQSNPIYRAVYKYLKRREFELLGEADAIIVLTHAGKKVLLGREDQAVKPPVTVIPCCADLAAFPTVTADTKAAARRLLGLEAEQKVVAYLGSIGSWYMLDEMLDLFRVQSRLAPNARFLIVSRDEPDTIFAAAARRGVPPEHLIIRPATRAQVPKYLAAADYGLFFIKPCFSKQASSPTKLGEFLALGLPVVTNKGVGDVDRIIIESGAGVLVEGFEEAAYANAVAAIDTLPREPEQWRIRARQWFDLDVGVEAYAGVYEAVERALKPHATQ
jgi:glycosyltransferase involved in cell wall biosynthesis